MLAAVQPLVFLVLQTFTPEHPIHSIQDILSCALRDGTRAKKIDITVVNMLFIIIQGCFINVFSPDLPNINMVRVCHNSALAKGIIICRLAATVVVAGILRTFVVSSFFSEVEILRLSPLASASTVSSRDYRLLPLRLAPSDQSLKRTPISAETAQCSNPPPTQRSTNRVAATIMP